MSVAFDHILKQVRDAEIQADPFPHLVIPQIFPPEFYRELLAAMPPPAQFVPAEYPGTGFGKTKAARPVSSGLAYPNLSALPLFAELQAFLRGPDFCRALLEKFSVPGGIPSDKYPYFSNGAQEFSSVFDLQIDRRGYEILPHADVATKIVTFQFFLVSDDSLKDFGTLFCRTRNGRPAARGAAARKLGLLLDRTAKTLGHRPAPFWYRLERTKLGTEIGFGDSKSWYPWRMFEIVSSAPALPNHFMAFAPSDRSYHAVRMNIPQSSVGRAVIRGFIRSGKNMENFIRMKGAEKM